MFKYLEERWIINIKSSYYGPLSKGDFKPYKKERELESYIYLKKLIR